MTRLAAILAGIAIAVTLWFAASLVGVPGAPGPAHPQPVPHPTWRTP